MNEKGRLKGIVLFWIAAVVPFAGIFLGRYLFYGAYGFFILLLIYFFIYRPILHVLRLLRLGVIEKKDAWKFFIPCYETKYFKDLWLG